MNAPPILGIIAIALYLSVWFALETQYQIKIRTAGKDSSDQYITIDQFNQRLQKGEQLAILDDMVLDVQSFISNHPGGKQFIERNISRDLSKFFYGGYAQDNLTQPYAHSMGAYQIASSLRIGHLYVTPTPRFNAVITTRDQVVTNTYTYTFEAAAPVKGVQKYYSDINVIGKHYLVGANDKKRQYTTCNCMERDAYKVYLQALESQDGSLFS